MLELLHHMYNSVLAFWRKLSTFHFQVLNNTTCHFPNCLENIAILQDKWWLACQMSNTSTIHLQRFIHFSQGTSLFRKFVNHFDASYRDSGPVLEPELIDLHCSDELGLNSNKVMCLLLQLFSYDKYPKMQHMTTICGSFSGSNSHLTCFK